MAGQSDEAVATSRNSNNSISLANLLNGIDKPYSNGEKIIDHSKVVDENGEPKVVWHGTPDAFTEFVLSDRPRNERFLGDGFYFSSSKELAQRFADKYVDSKHELIPAFLNIRDMIDFDARDTRDYYEEQHKQRIAIWNEKHKTKDGTVLRRINDGYDIEADTYVVRDANNIKSAT